MKNRIFTLIFLCCSLILQAQLAFEPSLGLFNHPNMPSDENFGFGLPFIPLDYNQDNITDFIGTSFNAGFLYKGTGNNEFEVIELASAQAPLQVMDFDGDGDQDVVMERQIMLYSEGDNFEILELDASFPEEIYAIADFDGDDDNDILTTDSNFGEEDFIIHYNNGDQTFTKTVVFETTFRYNAIAVGDIDNNGHIDIVALANSDTQPITTLMNMGMGTFTPNIVFDFFSLNASDLFLEDLDDDDDLDLIVSSEFGSIRIIENTDNFVYETNSMDISLPSFYRNEFLQMGDLNNDGRRDLLSLAILGSSFRVYYLLNNGSLNFDDPINIETIPGSSSFGFPTNQNHTKNNLSVYDYDYDGKKDLTYVDGVMTGDKQIYLLRNISDIPTSTNDPLFAENIDVFPNPFSNQINIVLDDLVHSLPNKQFYLYDVLGQEVLSTNLGNDVETLELTSPIASGIYFYQLVADGILLDSGKLLSE